MDNGDEGNGWKQKELNVLTLGGLDNPHPRIREVLSYETAGLFTRAVN